MMLTNEISIIKINLKNQSIIIISARKQKIKNLKLFEIRIKTKIKVIQIIQLIFDYKEKINIIRRNRNVKGKNKKEWKKKIN